MKIIYNNIIPFKGFACVNLFGVLFIRNGAMITERLLNHERIHTKQMRELCYIGFYIWYIIEWLIELIHYKDKSYYCNTFEREAYENDDDLTYLNNRRPFAFLKYI